MVIFASQGDPRRSIALLWREDRPLQLRAAPGPKPGLSVDLIVDAAIALADADGIAAVSMRAVGERLGRTAMALYTYVPTKMELIDLMYDRALGELPSEYTSDGGWRAALTTWAEDLRDFHLRHPWLLSVSQARPVLGPNEFRFLETLAGILHATGLPPAVLRGAVGALVNFVRGAAQAIADSRQAPAVTGVSDDEWWYARSGVLTDLVPEFLQRFPMVAWIESDNEPPPDDPTPYLEREARQAFDAGLVILLDGVEAAVARGATGGRGGRAARPARAPHRTDGRAASR